MDIYDSFFVQIFMIVEPRRTVAVGVVVKKREKEKAKREL